MTNDVVQVIRHWPT